MWLNLLVHDCQFDKIKKIFKNIFKNYLEKTNCLPLLTTSEN
jgi:hypothetical protein